MNQAIREALCDMGHNEAVVFSEPDYDEAIIGVTDEGRVIYDYDTMVRCLMKDDGMEELEAIEFLDVNTIKALQFAGENAPIIMHKILT